MANPNFTANFSATDVVHYNISYVIANQPPQMTTAVVWIIFALLGIGLLLLSVMSKEETCNDLSGILATLFLFISSIQAFAVDTVTGFGVTGVTDSGAHEFVLMENHTIYHYDFWGVALGVVFVMSLANIYRLWLDHKRITEQQSGQLDRNAMQPKDGGPDQRNKKNDRNDSNDE